MTAQTNWQTIAAQTIYRSYPDSDLLPIAAPESGTTIRTFKVQAEDAGDTLFLFLCREADDDCMDAGEYLRRLDRAICDIEQVRRAVAQHASAITRL